MHQQQQFDDAERIYKALLQEYPGDFDLLNMLGVVHGQRGDFVSAADYLKRALAIDPASAPAHFAYGNVLKSQGNRETALESFERALALQARDADIWNSHGATLADLACYPQAVVSYDRALAINANHLHALCNRGAALCHLGRYEEALASLDSAVALQPEHGPAHHQRGLVLLDMARLDDARESLGKALQLMPDSTDVLASLAYVEYRLACFDSALALYDRALLIQPARDELHLGRGILLQAMGLSSEALGAFDNVLSLDSGHAEAHLNKGLILAAQKRFELALACYAKALALKPDYVEVHNNQGLALIELQREQEALESFRAALAIRPEHTPALFNRGNLLLKLKRFGHATSDFEKLVAIKPDDAQAHDCFSTACRALGRPAEAEHHLRRAIELNPGVANFYYNIATLLMHQGRLDEAIDQLGKALDLNANHHAARSVIVHLMQKICRWDGLHTHTEVLRSSLYVADESAESMIAPFLYLAFPGTTPAEQKRCAERWAEYEYKSHSALGRKLAFVHERPIGTKINVAYLSADFRNHSVSRLMVRVLELHNRNQFHVSAYSYGPDDGSSIRARVQKAVDRFVDISDMTDVEAAARIHDDGVHVLVDLTGFTELSRSGILALRPAPLQMSYLGYVGTMGANFVDYLITDRFIVPEDQRAHYAEKPLYLPNCFQASDSARSRSPAPLRSLCGLPENAFVFCCFNHTYKITPDVFDVWCRLLTAVPNSVLWLVKSTADAELNLAYEAKRRGVDPARLIMAPLVPTADYLARMQCADLYLDTSPYNAGTTANDALWMGLPLVTCAGETFTSRMAGSLLMALGVPELIACNFDDYYRIALDLAADSGKLRTIRDKIRENSAASSLFDCAKTTRDLEACFLDAASALVAGTQVG